MKNLNNMKPLGVRDDSIMKLLRLYEFRGKSKHYDETFKSDQAKLIKDNIKKELLYFAEFYNLNITDARKKTLYKKDCEPKNKDEQVYINVKEILTRILADPDSIYFEDYQFLDLAQAVYRNADKINFRTYRTSVSDGSLFGSTKLISLRDEFKDMIGDFKYKYEHKSYEVTNLLTNFFVDYKNQEIFTKYNDELSYMILYSLILKCRFTVFKYVTFFDKLIKHRAELNDAIISASINYEEGYSNPAKLNDLIIDILLESYDQIEAELNSYSFEYRNTKVDLIIGIILKLPQQFTRDDIKNAEPLASDSTINRALKYLSDNNQIRALGTGRSAKWIKLEERIDPLSSRQMDIFNVEE